MDMNLTLADPNYEIMSSNRFVHLQQLDDDDDEQPRSSSDTHLTHANTSISTKSGKKKRSSNFTWRVLTEPSLNRTEPRGLVNRSNFCYLNAVLQPLLLCQPFVNIIGNLRDRITLHRHHLKWLPAFLDLIEAFAPKSDGPTKDFSYIRSPVSPEGVYRCWEHSEEQEDAEEFLRLILNGLHEELLRYRVDLGWALPSFKGILHEKQTVEDEWMSVVGQGKRVATSRTLIEPPSPMSVLVNGVFKSVVKSAGSKDSHVSEPFQFLPLDISDGSSVFSAIEHLTMPERIGQKSTKQLLIDRVPPLLIIHLKRFVFNADTGQASKSFAHVNIPEELDLSECIQNWGDDVFFSADEPLRFKLMSVVYHMGRFTHGGHYTCHVYHGDAWFYCDDGTITRTPPRESVVGMMAMERNRTPYLLFYLRLKVNE